MITVADVPTCYGDCQYARERERESHCTRLSVCSHGRTRGRTCLRELCASACVHRCLLCAVGYACPSFSDAHHLDNARLPFCP